MAETVGKGYIK